MITKEDYLAVQRDICELSETGPANDATVLGYFYHIAKLQETETDPVERLLLLHRKVAVASTIIWRYEEANKINQIIP